MSLEIIKNNLSSNEILKKAVIDCFDYAKQKQQISVDIIKSYLEPVFKQEGYREENQGETDSILVIRLDEIGDNVMTTGFMRELRKNYPKAYITLIVNPIVAPLMELCPYVNEVIGFSVNSVNGVMERFEGIASFCYQKLWKKRYSLAFVMRWDVDGNRFANFLAYFSGARERIGYSSIVTPIKKQLEPYIDELLTMPVENPSDIVHEVYRNFYLLTAKKLHIENYDLELWYGKDDYIHMKKILSEFSKGRKIIAVASGSNWLHKNYPSEKLCMALKKIQNGDNCFVFLGGQSEKEYGQYLHNELSDSSIDLTGRTTLKETAAALSLCSMYIGMDTGTKHMAAALKLPVIEINCSPLTLKPSPLLLVNRCAPWRTPSIIVRPKKPLSPCDKSNPWGGCEKIGECHCISQVNPEEIVAAYNKLSAIEIYSD